MEQEKAYTLKDLAELTGFSERQIRFYVTEGLVPGAGRKGPNVTYGEPILRRLRLVGRLKEMRVQPTGRTLSLSEIRQVIDTLGEDGAVMMLEGGAELSILSTDDVPRPPAMTADAAPPESAREYIRRVRDPDRKPERRPAPDLQSVRETSALYAADEGIHASFLSPARTITPRGPLADLLRDLLLALRELTVDEQPPATGSAEAWRRIATPDVEIQVRVPDTPARLRHLEAIAHELERLFDREEKP